MYCAAHQNVQADIGTWITDPKSPEEAL